MAPISPDSLKRGSASQSSDDEAEEPMRKKIRLEEPQHNEQPEESGQFLPQTPPPEEVFNPLPIHKTPLFNDDPEQLLTRSIVLALQHVGFEGAQPEALAAMLSEVDACEYSKSRFLSRLIEADAEHFLSKITSSMLNGRRSQPTPLDYYYGLEQFDIPIASLKPHLKPPIPLAKSHIQLEPLPFIDEELEKQKFKELTKLLGKELDGAVDKEKRSHIPKKFIPYPSKHTYKFTPRDDRRETDTRKIRETAAKEARLGEEALRRLITVGKSGKANDVKKAASKDALGKEKHEQWERVMASFASLSAEQNSRQRIEEEDQTMIVNSESRFYRKGVASRRKPEKPAIPPDLGLIEGA